MNRWLVFDTETTGLTVPSTAPVEKQPKIIDLGLVELLYDMGDPDVDAGWRVCREHSWLLNPGEQIGAEITKITGLKDDDLRGQPSFPEILPQLVQIFHGAAGLLSHNLPFDLALLVNELKRCSKEHAFPYPPQQICTVAHYMPTYGRRAKLTEVYERVLGKPLAQKHRALDDARALAEIVIKEKIIA
jgi:DNA polymerase III epsilon subunit-like protein